MADKSFQSVTGAPEMAEPTDSNTSILPTDHQSSVQPRVARPPSSVSSLPTPKKVFNTQTTSATTSPKPSRESSPIRPDLKTNIPNRAAGRARKNSAQEASPTRSSNATGPTLSSTAAARKGLSTANIPQLFPSVSDPIIKAPIPQKIVPSESRDLPRWPVSPRLRSPPPVIKPLTQARKGEQELPAINVQRSTPTTEGSHFGTETEDQLGISGMRTPARGVSGTGSTLETVQEISQPSTPALGLDGSRETSQDGLRQTLEQSNTIDQAFAKALKPKPITGANESGSESGGKTEMKMRASSLAPTTTSALPNTVPPTKSHSTSSATVRGKAPGEESTKNMTVETETVSSIPQVAVGGGTGGPGNSSSLRAKPSSETIRPKKERKKTSRKAPSVTSGTGEHPDSLYRRERHRRSARSLSESHFHTSPIRPESAASYVDSRRNSAASPLKRTGLRRPSGSRFNVNALLTRRLRTASSKADIFEAKIATAVGEADSSDSEETFVYESNPPEINERPRRFHSRTPSATSMVSQIDQRGNRAMHGVMEGVHGVAMKKSMKFANSYNSNGPEVGTGEDDGRGTVRSNMGTGRGTTHHHHIGRWGRNVGNGHQSLFDNESPFPNAAKSKFPGTNQSRNSSRPSSPRVSHVKLGNGKKGSPVSSGYDIDDGAGADDERTPLIGSTIRSNRSGRGRRQPFSTSRQLEHQSRDGPSYLNRFAGFFILVLMVLLAVSGAVGFLFASSQPLAEVEIVSLKHIIATEEELILDMEVSAKNPNIMAINVELVNLELFAKSKHSEGDFDWWHLPPLPANIGPQRRSRSMRTRRATFSSSDNSIHILDDDPNDPYDPPDDPDADPDDSKTLLIGHVLALDSSLVFDGSPFKHARSLSVGEIRLAKPGNTTEADNTARWANVLKYNFDLLLSGTLKYQLPMSQKTRNATVNARVVVVPGQNQKVVL